jgi:glycosyltransferase involved in cell wall biosynthesis
MECKQDMITITLPVYNAMPLLKNTVESVLNQSFKEFAFVIIDDGSTDDSLEYLSSLTDKRIHLITRKNKGLGYTLNELFSLSKTKYVARLDADDICHKDRIKEQIDFMENNPDVVMAGTGIHFICDNVAVKASPTIIKHDTIVEKLLIKRFSICHPSVIILNKAFKQVGGYQIDGAGEDLDFFLRMSEVGRLANIDRDLLGYRLSFSSLSMSKRNELHLGYDYALKCYFARSEGVDEPGFIDFSKSHRSIKNNMANRVDELSEQVYRAAIFAKARRQKIRFLVALFLAAILRPRTACFRVKSLLKNYLNS